MGPEPIFFIVFLCALPLILILLGALSIWAACWVYNALFPYTPNLAAALVDPVAAPRYLVDQSNPYASPSAGYSGTSFTPGVPPPADVPMPSFLYSLAISTVGGIASFITYLGVFLLCAVPMGMMPTPGAPRSEPPVLFALALGIGTFTGCFFALSLVLSLMLPTTYPRAMLVSFFSGLAFFMLYLATGMIMGVLFLAVSLIMR